MEAELIGIDRLLIDGHVYRKHENRVKTTYWKCIKCYNGSASCRARASTPHFSEIGEKALAFRGPKESPHNHPPESVEVEIARTRVVSVGRRNTFIRIGAGARVGRYTYHPKVDQKTISCSEKIKAVRGSNAHTGCHLQNFKRIDVVEDISEKREDARSTLHETDFTKDPVRYQKFLLRFAEDPSFDKKSIIRALGAVMPNLGVSLTTACALVQSKRSEITTDLTKLSINIVNPTVPSSPMVTSTNSIDEVTRPDNPSSDVQSTKTSSVSQARTKKKKHENDKLISLLTSTVEATFKTMQHFTEFMAAKTHEMKNKKKKEKKRKREKVVYRPVKVRIIPPVPDNVSMNDVPPRASPSVSRSVRSERLTENIKQEIPVVDLTDDDDVKPMKMNLCSGNQSNIRIESVRSLASGPNIAPAGPFPPEHLISNCSHPTRDDLVTSGNLEGHQYAIPPLTREFVYCPVSPMQHMNPERHPLAWDVNNKQKPIQNSTRMCNSFATNASRLSTSKSIQMSPRSHTPR